MNYKLPEVIATLKTGEEKLTFEGESLGANLQQFWQWSTSDILSNATRGRFAEFIVATAIGIAPNVLRDEWDSYDLKSEEGIKIEVKSASYIQSWAQKDYSKITFSIKAARHWEDGNGGARGSAKRHADVYVFCLLKNKDQETIDPLKLEQWSFFVLLTSDIDNYPRSSTSITLKSLANLSEEIPYTRLKEEIYKAYKSNLENK